MRQHVDDRGTSNRFRLRNQDERAELFKNWRRKSLDELRYLIIEFRQASPYVHFSAAEWDWLDDARIRVAKLEMEAVLR
jgi:hypothetical protein